MTRYLETRGRTHFRVFKLHFPIRLNDRIIRETKSKIDRSHSLELSRLNHNISDNSWPISRFNLFTDSWKIFRWTRENKFSRYILINGASVARMGTFSEIKRSAESRNYGLGRKSASATRRHNFARTLIVVPRLKYRRRLNEVCARGCVSVRMFRVTLYEIPDRVDPASVIEV